MEKTIALLGKFKEIIASEMIAHTPKEVYLIMNLPKGDVPKLKRKVTFEALKKIKINAGDFYIINHTKGSLIFRNSVSYRISAMLLIIEVIHSSFKFSIFKDNKMIRSVDCIMPDESFDGKLHYTETGTPLEVEKAFNNEDPMKLCSLIQSVSGIDIDTIKDDAEVLHFRSK